MGRRRESHMAGCRTWRQWGEGEEVPWLVDERGDKALGGINVRCGGGSVANLLRIPGRGGDDLV